MHELVVGDLRPGEHEPFAVGGGEDELVADLLTDVSQLVESGSGAAGSATGPASRKLSTRSKLRSRM